MKAGAALGISMGIGLAAGMASYTIETLAYGEKWNALDFAKAGFSGAAQAGITFGMGYMAGRNGFFRSMLKDPSDFLKVRGLTAVTSKVLTLSRYPGAMITQAILVSAPAAGIRWLIDTLIKLGD